MSEYLDMESEEAEFIAGSQDFMKHLHAMTGESLHSKSSIAIEFARRDIDNRSLKGDIELLKADNALLKDKVKEFTDLLTEYRKRGDISINNSSDFYERVDKALTTNSKG